MKIEVFKKEEFGEIRTVVRNEEVLFALRDVAKCLGYENPSKAVIMHCKSGLFPKREDASLFAEEIDNQMVNEENPSIVKVYIQHANGIGGIYVEFGTEEMVYRLIFGSRMESAEAFKTWVFKDVLPSIRKHGMYATDVTIDRILNDPDFGIELLQKLKEERKKRVEAEKTVNILMHVNKTYTMTEIAKELNMRSAIELNKELSKRGIQYHSNGTWVLTAPYSECGYTEIKQEVLDSGKVIYHRRITQLGRNFILNLFRR